MTCVYLHLICSVTQVLASMCSMQKHGVMASFGSPLLIHGSLDLFLLSLWCCWWPIKPLQPASTGTLTCVTFLQGLPIDLPFHQDHFWLTLMWAPVWNSLIHCEEKETAACSPPPLKAVLYFKLKSSSFSSLLVKCSAHQSLCMENNLWQECMALKIIINMLWAATNKQMCRRSFWI